MQTKRERLIFLHHLSTVTRRMLYRLQQYDPTLNAIFTMNSTEIRELLHIPMKKAVQLYKDLQHPKLPLQIQKDLQHIQVLTIYDEHYPTSLKMIPDAPLVLYMIGDIQLLNQHKSISVIGTRKPSHEASAKLTHIVSPLVKADWLIVSGLAYGIDSMAHQLALQHHGQTIAVLGGGFRHIYPKPNMQLFQEMTKNNLVITEYPPDKRPQKYHFPERNRVISGLTRATLVIEATERSGTLITVDQALDQGREVYAVPGSPLLPQTKGCHKMIQEGAKLVMNAQDILEDWS